MRVNRIVGVAWMQVVCVVIGCGRDPNAPAASSPSTLGPAMTLSVLATPIPPVIVPAAASDFVIRVWTLVSPSDPTQLVSIEAGGGYSGLGLAPGSALVFSIDIVDGSGLVIARWDGDPLAVGGSGVPFDELTTTMTGPAPFLFNGITAPLTIRLMVSTPASWSGQIDSVSLDVTTQEISPSPLAVIPGP